MSGQTLAALAVAVALGGCTSAEQPGETLAGDPEPAGGSGAREPSRSYVEAWARLESSMMWFANSFGNSASMADSMAVFDSFETFMEFSDERFELYTGCAPVRPWTPFGPREHYERSREMAETRLRNAGIFREAPEDPEDPFDPENLSESFASAAAAREDGRALGSTQLYIDYNPLLDRDEAWITKPVWDPISGEIGEVRTWEHNGLMFRAMERLALDREPNVSEVMSVTVDDFITEYLRVNADACR